MRTMIFVVATVVTTTPTMASDASYCRDWARDTLAIGRILVEDLAHANDGVLRTKSQALYQVCISEGLAPSDGVNYEVDTSPKKVAVAPPSPKKKAIKPKGGVGQAVRKVRELGSEDSDGRHAQE